MNDTVRRDAAETGEVCVGIGEGTLALEAGAAGDGFADDAGEGTGGAGGDVVGGAEDGDGGNAEGGGHVHGTGVVGEDDVAGGEQLDEFS